ncbi:TetR/AcrR family transcriptional regulator [Mycolicibacterium porcinum]|uniref:TetR/AcrR family transcriptional regulator n=1 Tax=Mycolicibacterium porcinum TaxID=39693 RepID=A0AAW5T425_9MYCO|nr:TetR/AcrR family transcriptional regulator [Mycolicibacterium porcinum]MBX8691839.1 TetR family transcriptional regulator [Mycobacterium sp. 20091114027_K0903767]CDO27492.1 transcriptional regulator [Mycolicibacterium vulneris]MCV7389590.1 TetR/AcrR family transcriptional regulator [Mycolicibacterium porcinum]ORB40101.1 TetR family transcriptional regulator [Mycolicibacterium porcinum]TVY06337.1 TetR/AcrR family transcriptional regulator [Mycolicibacterium porcinum]
MARRRGWDGRPPGSDEEASERIVAAAVQLIAETGTGISIADVAASLGVIRQTVYRYFPTAESLMHAAAIATVDGFLDRLAESVRGITDPAEAMTEGVMFTLEEVARVPHLRIMLSGPQAVASSVNVASDEGQAFGMRMITRFDVDWEKYGYDEAALRELVEFTLRTMLSFFVAPNDPGRSREELRRFLRRWLGGSILAQPVDGKR